MVANSDVVVACIQHSWGGAATTLKYAERKKKRIVSIDVAPKKRDNNYNTL